MVPTRPPTATSIPSLLSSLQTEWDAIALETFSLRKQLIETKRELSTALYQNDAAVRVVARLTKERDEAREALSKLTASLGGSSGETMQVDASEELATSHGNGNATAIIVNEDVSLKLSPQIVNELLHNQQELQAGRRKRPISDQWVTDDEIRNFSETHKTKQLFASVSCGATYNNLLITGGGKGKTGVFNCENNDLDTFNVDGVVSSVGWSSDGTNIVVGTKNGSADIILVESLEKVSGSASRNLHNTPVIFAGFLPSSTTWILTVDKEGGYKISDRNGKVESQVELKQTISAARIHPDGVLTAFATFSGGILFYDITTSELMAKADAGAPVSSIAFSENGYWMAAGIDSAVLLYDLRKAPDLGSVFEPVTTLPFETLEGPVMSLAFDYSGRYLIAGTLQGFEVISYEKSKKSWNANVFSAKLASISVNWTSLAKSIAVVTPKGNIVIFG